MLSKRPFFGKNEVTCDFWLSCCSCGYSESLLANHLPNRAEGDVTFSALHFLTGIHWSLFAWLQGMLHEMLLLSPFSFIRQQGGRNAHPGLSHSRGSCNPQRNRRPDLLYSCFKNYYLICFSFPLDQQGKNVIQNSWGKLNPSHIFFFKLLLIEFNEGVQQTAMQGDASGWSEGTVLPLKSRASSSICSVC